MWCVLKFSSEVVAAVTPAKPSVSWIVTIPDQVRLRPIVPARTAHRALVYLVVPRPLSKSMPPKGVSDLAPGPARGLDHDPDLVPVHGRVPDLDRAPTARHRRRTVHRRVRKTTTMLRHDRTRRRSGVRKIRAIPCRRSRPEAAAAPRTVAGTIGRGRVRRNRIGRTLLRRGIVTCHGTPVDPTLARS